MRKYVFILFLLSVAASVMAQKKSVVNLIRSKSSAGIKRNGKDVIKVYQGTFKQDFSTLSSDSAYFYPQDNAFEAFGHININQGDTLNIYADKLNYNGNTKIAILTDNVKMVDKDATLTTNHLTYNTATRIGIYTDGGKLVNKDNTLISKNGYYFALSRDSYFRYNVLLTTADALIKTDTMRYNTGSKIAYFYGPTHIYGTKDKDTLYTENGTYNTNTEQAAFGKKNLYKQGTKSLKGDSLFYDRLKGYGRAVKHITFSDSEQKITIKGDLGTYFKADERTLVTKDPYVILVTEEKDSTKTDTVPITKRDSVKKLLTHIGKLPIQNKAAASAGEAVKNTIIAKVDTVALLKKDTVIKLDSVKKLLTHLGKLPVAKVNPPPQKKPVVTNSKNTRKPDGKGLPPNKIIAAKDTGKIKRDSIYMSGDTIETQVFVYKDYKVYLEKQRLSRIRDTTVKVKGKKPAVKEKPSKLLTAAHAGFPRDTGYFLPLYFGKPKPVAPSKKSIAQANQKKAAADSVRKYTRADSLRLNLRPELSDTARIRVVIIHHHAKLFKSDLQAKADSMFYSYRDSTLRCYVNPIIWTQGSQLSGDTINLQMRNKKLDNMLMFPNAFIVNIEKDDSLNFNQVAGKQMQGYFKKDKLYRMFINGNAESIYFSRDSVKKTVDGMERSLSSRMRVDFKDNSATNIAFYTKPEQKYGPIDKFKEDDKILKGFIWKPKERPVSKESIIPSYRKKQEAKAAASKPKTGAPPLKKLKDGKMGVDSTLKTLPGKLPVIKAGKDTTVKVPPVKLPGAKVDTAKAAPVKVIKKDTVKNAPVKKPGS
ncbi:hypothetical protein BH09BAC6_BH09BAC6_09770 [soil metagenome]